MDMDVFSMHLYPEREALNSIITFIYFFLVDGVHHVAISTLFTPSILIEF